MVEHVSITDPNIHEAKGASTATSGQILTANGSGQALFVTPTFTSVDMGWYDYNDTATTGTPIALTAAGTYYDLTNNGLGVNTQIGYGLSGVTNLWNTSTNRFDFTNLAVGDTVDLRVDLTYTTASVNTAIDIVLEIGVGQPEAFLIPLLISNNFKTAGTHRVIAEKPFYIGSSLTKDNPARVRAKADGTGSTVIVNGWFARVITRS